MENENKNEIIDENREAVGGNGMSDDKINVYEQRARTDEINAEPPKSRFNVFALLSCIFYVSQIVWIPLAFALDELAVFDSGTSFVFFNTSLLLTPVSIVMMIIARVRDPKSKFGRVMMWIWIITAIVAVIALILFIAVFATCLTMCAVANT